METEMKPCPFCGSDRITVRYIRDGAQAVCKDCNSSATPTFHGPSGYEDTWVRARSKWNVRAHSSELLECLVEARKHLDGADIDLGYIDEVIAKAKGDKT